MIRLDEGVFVWSSFDQERRLNFNGFLICGEERCVVVDPPPLADDDRAYLEALGLWPDMLVLTNRNHARDRDWWLTRRPIPTAMHEAEVSQVDFKIDHPLREGDVVGPGLRVVHVPGKSPGEISLHSAQRGLLLVGDALVGPVGRLKLLPEAKLDDPALLKRSLRKLTELDFHLLLLADGDPVCRDAKKHVADFVSTL